MIKAKCTICGDVYPAGTGHECLPGFGKLSLPVSPTLVVRGAENFQVVLYTPHDQAFVHQAIAFYEKHLARSREGMKKHRAAKKEKS